MSARGTPSIEQMTATEYGMRVVARAARTAPRSWHTSSSSVEKPSIGGRSAATARGREHLGDEAADAGVVRRLQAQQRPLLVLVEARPPRVGLGPAELGVGVAVRVAAAQPAVAQGLLHVGEAGDRPLAGASDSGIRAWPRATR